MKYYIPYGNVIDAGQDIREEEGPMPCGLPMRKPIGAGIKPFRPDVG